MNIKITYNWLLEYLETDASPYELQKYLSLCGPSVERVEKKENDYILDIEITSNRVDMASVFGIAQEAQAILPQFGKKAKLKINPLQKYHFNFVPSELEGPDSKKLTIHIKEPELCSRFTALVLSNVSIKPAPEQIRKRLRLCEIKSISNVIDISNYLMLSLGQPTHIFDYDKIGKHTMILRESKKGEKMTTLDEKEIELPGGDIVIEDGNGALIDLCGIMGGLNSSVTEKTKNIVLFVQTYDKKRIRKTSVTTGQRTIAATYFEKGLDEERVEPTLVYGVELLKECATASVSSKLYDIYPQPYVKRTVRLFLSDVVRVMGVEPKPKKIEEILSSLGFTIAPLITESVQVGVPSYRTHDISIKEDLIEEIARIYGYHNLPMNLQPPVHIEQPKEMEELFVMQSRLKHFLKHLGLRETMNYSMLSKSDLQNLELEIKHHLPLANPITEDLKFMRTSLLLSLVKNLKENQGKKTVLQLFEIAKVYYPQENELPVEVYKLGIGTNTSFSDIKGVVEVVLLELNIKNYEFRKSRVHIFSEHVQADVIVDNRTIGTIGQLKPALQLKNQLRSPVFLAGIDLKSLIEFQKLIAKYKPINQYATIKLDLTAKLSNFAEFKKKAFSTSELLIDLKVVSIFNENVTVRFYFSASDNNLTEKEAQQELEKIKEKV